MFLIVLNDLPFLFDTDHSENGEGDSFVEIAAFNRYGHHQTSHDQHVSILKDETCMTEQQSKPVINKRISSKMIFSINTVKPLLIKHLF